MELQSNYGSDKPHDSSIKIHDRKLHVLLTTEAFSKSVAIYAFQRTQVNTVRIKRIFFTRKIPAEIWESNKK